jgi:uncharacterized membrane protein YfhO
MVQDYYGTSAYHSFNQKNYILFLQSVDIVDKEQENESRWARGLRGHPALESLGSVKYFFEVDDNSPFINMLRMNYDSIAQFGDVKVLQNKYFLPMGIAFDTYFTRSEFDKMSSAQKDFMMLRGFFIKDDEAPKYAGLSRFNLKDTLAPSSYTWETLGMYTQELKKDTFKMETHGQTFFKGTIGLEKKKLVFFSIPFDKGWKASVDGAEQELVLVDAGMTGLIVDKGNHTIELHFDPRFRKEGMIVSVASLGLFGFLVWRKRKQKQTAV